MVGGEVRGGSQSTKEAARRSLGDHLLIGKKEKGTGHGGQEDGADRQHALRNGGKIASRVKGVHLEVPSTEKMIKTRIGET